MKKIPIILVCCLGLTACDDQVICNKTSAAKMYFLTTDSSLSTSTVKHKIILKTGKKNFFWRGQKVCYATYKNVNFDKDMQFYLDMKNHFIYATTKYTKNKRELSSQSKQKYLDHIDKTEYPQKTTTLCYTYNPETKVYIHIDGEGCCQMRKGSADSEDVCWL